MDLLSAGKQNAFSVLTGFKFLPEIFAIAMCLGIYTIGYIKGNTSCEISKGKEELAAATKDSKNHAKIKLKNDRLSTPALDLRLDRWVRND